MASTSYTAWNHHEWDEAGLKDFADFAECVEYVNQSDDYGDSMRGEWYYGDDATMTVYSGSFGNDHSPGASSYTYATVYEDLEEFRKGVSEWELCPEYVE